MRRTKKSDRSRARRRAISIAEFCAEIGITTRTYYNHRDEMPPAIRAGRRLIILQRAIDEWEREKLDAARDATSTDVEWKS